MVDFELSNILMAELPLDPQEPVEIDHSKDQADGSGGHCDNLLDIGLLCGVRL